MQPFAIFLTIVLAGITSGAPIATNIRPREVANPTTTKTATAGVCPDTWPSGKPDFNQVPTSCGVSWLDTINEWRHTYGKPNLTWSPHLAEVAYIAGIANNGGAQNGPFIHSDLKKMNSNGKTETPGYVIPPPGANLHGQTPFGAALLNWLCEVPDQRLVQDGIDVCQKIVAEVDHVVVAGQRGHHDIVLGNYRSVGCAFVFNTKKSDGVYAGAYVCDYAL